MLLIEVPVVLVLTQSDRLQQSSAANISSMKKYAEDHGIPIVLTSSKNNSYISTNGQAKILSKDFAGELLQIIANTQEKKKQEQKKQEQKTPEPLKPKVS